jgi:hypothetical protein
MEPPAARSTNQSIQQGTAAAQRLAQNREASEAVAKQEYPNEKFMATTVKLQTINKFTEDLELPENVRLAESRVPRSKGDAEKQKKELRQAGILARCGNSVYLTPEPGRYKERVSDAIVNGVHYEFRNITGKAEKIERRFSEAKEKGSANNVFINVDSNVSKDEARRRIGEVLGRHPDYTGKIVVSFKGKKPYFWDSCSFR